MEDELAARRIEERSILSAERVERAAARRWKVTIPPAGCNRGPIDDRACRDGGRVMKVKVDVGLH
jgi:hypothetical protein